MSSIQTGPFLNPFCARFELHIWLWLCGLLLISAVSTVKHHESQALANHLTDEVLEGPISEGFSLALSLSLILARSLLPPCQKSLQKWHKQFKGRGSAYKGSQRREIHTPFRVCWKGSDIPQVVVDDVWGPEGRRVPSVGGRLELGDLTVELHMFAYYTSSPSVVVATATAVVVV